MRFRQASPLHYAQKEPAVAKVSVYVPDDLLREAKESEGTDNTSRAVQAGLRRLIEETSGAPAYVDTPHFDSNVVNEITERMRNEAREIYEHGYSLGIEMAKVMPWELLDRLAEYEFDLAQLDEDTVGRHAIPGSEDWADELGMIRDFWEVNEKKRQRYGTTIDRAIRHALRDIWLAVQRDAADEPGSEAGSE